MIGGYVEAAVAFIEATSTDLCRNLEGVNNAAEHGRLWRFSLRCLHYRRVVLEWMPKQKVNGIIQQNSMGFPGETYVITQEPGADRATFITTDNVRNISLVIVFTGA